MAEPVGHLIEGVLKKKIVIIVCPGCGETVEAVAWDEVVKGYCAKAKKHIRVVVEK